MLGSELSQDAAFKSAVDEVTYLRLSLFDFRQSLKQMDAAEREKNQGKLDQQYKEARVEMIKVIHDLDNSSLRITKLLQRLYEYKLKLTEQIQQPKDTWKFENNISISFCTLRTRCREKFMMKVEIILMSSRFLQRLAKFLSSWLEMIRFKSCLFRSTNSSSKRQ